MHVDKYVVCAPAIIGCGLLVDLKPNWYSEHSHLTPPSKGSGFNSLLLKAPRRGFVGSIPTLANGEGSVVGTDEEKARSAHRDQKPRGAGMQFRLK